MNQIELLHELKNAYPQLIFTIDKTNNHILAFKDKEVIGLILANVEEVEKFKNFVKENSDVLLG